MEALWLHAAVVLVEGLFVFFAVSLSGQLWLTTDSFSYSVHWSDHKWL